MLDTNTPIMPRWLHRSYYRTEAQANGPRDNEASAPSSLSANSQSLTGSMPFITNALGSQTAQTAQTLTKDCGDVSAVCIQIMFDLNAQKHRIASLENHIREMSEVPRLLRQALQEADNKPEDCGRQFLRDSMGSAEFQPRTEHGLLDVSNFSNSSFRSTMSRARPPQFRDFYDRSSVASSKLESYGV